MHACTQNAKKKNESIWFDEIVWRDAGAVDAVYNIIFKHAKYSEFDAFSKQ